MENVAAKLMSICLRVLTGAVPRFAQVLPENGQYIFYANHSSHLDAVVLWALLPSGLRAHTRPVAARDYWMKGPLRRALALHVFNVVMVVRGGDHHEDEAGGAHAIHKSLDDMSEALRAGSSLIIFPEGTRGNGAEMAPFKSGLYHLAKSNPGIPLIPVYIENLNRILPKGEAILIPLICNAHFGEVIRLDENETKASFLGRARRAMEVLKQ